MLKGVNWIAVIVATVLLEVLGFLWYGPLFGAAWTAAMANPPVTEAATAMNMKMGLGVVNTLIVVLGLDWLLRRLGAAGLTAAVMVPLAAWFFFSFTTQALEYLYMGMTLNFVAINMGYLLAAFVIVGATLSLVKFGAARAAAA
jgi:hypothetical protein